MSDALTPTPGIDAGPLGAWLADRVPGSVAPFHVELIAGGRSNLTYRVTDAAGATWALRRPPLGHVLATAHDMGREFRIISALAGGPVPVADAVAFCDDPAVNGAPFYVMGFVEGTVVRDLEVGETITPEVRRAACWSLVEHLAALHRIDVDAVGLGDLGRRDGYIERQLRRWMAQVGQSAVAELTIFAEVHDLLASAIPEQATTAIVHGDYRLENTVIGPDGSLRAVLDWELCTLGDPLADLGLLLTYWPGPGPTDPVTPHSATTLPGFLTPEEMIDGYAAASGRQLDQIPYYRAFSEWRLACIGAGVYTRYVAGAMGSTEGIDLEQMRSGVELRAERALDRLRAEGVRR